MTMICYLKSMCYAQIIEDQVPDLLEGKRAHSQSSAHSSNSKLFLEANPDLLEVSCTQIQAPTHPSKSVSHHSHSTQFKYSNFSV